MTSSFLFCSVSISGGFLICGRRLINKGWFEFVAGAGNGPLIGVKGSRNLTNKIFCNGDFTLNFRKNGIIPGIVGSASHLCNFTYFSYANVTCSIDLIDKTIVDFHF